MFWLSLCSWIRRVRSKSHPEVPSGFQVKRCHFLNCCLNLEDKLISSSNCSTSTWKLLFVVAFSSITSIPDSSTDIWISFFCSELDEKCQSLSSLYVATVLFLLRYVVNSRIVILTLGEKLALLGEFAQKVHPWDSFSELQYFYVRLLRWKGHVLHVRYL